MSLRFHGLRCVALLALAGTAASAPVLRTGSGANPAAIQAVIDQFRTDLGGINNGVNPPAASGRREINWDGVPDSFSAPNFLPANFFNVNSPRGVVFNTVKESSGLNQFRVSATASSGTAVRFGDIDPSYTTTFQSFSAERLFQIRAAANLEMTFFVPGTTQPATVAGFGVVFTDVDVAGNAVVRCFGQDGRQIAVGSAPTASGGLSFVGFTFTVPTERCYRVLIRVGTTALAAGTVDGASFDVVAMDDFLYGEPAGVFQ